MFHRFLRFPGWMLLVINHQDLSPAFPVSPVTPFAIHSTNSLLSNLEMRHAIHIQQPRMIQLRNNPTWYGTTSQLHTATHSYNSPAPLLAVSRKWPVAHTSGTLEPAHHAAGCLYFSHVSGGMGLLWFPHRMHRHGVSSKPSRFPVSPQPPYCWYCFFSRVFVWRNREPSRQTTSAAFHFHAVWMLRLEDSPCCQKVKFKWVWVKDRQPQELHGLLFTS